MELTVTKKDVLWGYAAVFFNMCTGLITLPLILKMLSAEEVGMNYLMLSVAQMVALFDCGFVGLLGRNISYVLSGAQTISKLGISGECNQYNINYHLLVNLIDTAKYIYRRIAIIVLFVMLTLGTIYMYQVTDKFSNVDNALLIWLLFSFSTFLNMYFLYIKSLLAGAALVKESQQATVYSKLVYLILCFSLLLCDFGLISVVVANLISPFVQRWYGYKKFYNEEIKEAIRCFISTKEEIKETFDIIWYTAKRLAINTIASYACAHSGLFISGLFLKLSDIASYGLLVQLFTALTAVSTNVFNSYNSIFCKLRVHNDIDELQKKLSFSVILLIIIFFIGAAIIIFLGPLFIELLKSKAQLPSMWIMIFFAINCLFANIHAQAAVFISTGNQIPFINAAVLSGIAIVLLTTLLLYFNLGIISLILAPFIVHSAYNNWYWPRWAIREVNLNLLDFFIIGIKQVYCKVINLFRYGKGII